LGRRLTPLSYEGETTDVLLSSIAVARESFSAEDGAERERRPLSPERQHYMKLQGEYVGHVRRLTLRQKEQVKALRARDGIQAAVAFAKKLAKC
jgi:hypothetical protein